MRELEVIETLRHSFFIKYRIVAYKNNGYVFYECQVRKLWWPIWKMAGYVNVHATKEKAIRYMIDFSKNPY